MRYRVVKLRVVDGEPVDVDGRIVAVLDTHRASDATWYVTALVESWT